MYCPGLAEEHGESKNASEIMSEVRVLAYSIFTTRVLVFSVCLTDNVSHLFQTISFQVLADSLRDI